MPRLTVIDGPDEGKSFEIGPQAVTVGHHPSRDIVLSDDRVSRMHLTIFRRSDEVVVRDENSTNGTFLNGKPIREAALRSGDCLLIGDTVLLYEDERQPLPAAETGEGVVFAPSDSETLVSPTDATVVVGGPAQTRLAGPRPGVGDAADTILAGPAGPPGAPRAGGPPSGPRPAPADLVPVVREAVAAARPLASGRGVELRLSAPTSAPSPVDPNVAYRLVARLLECSLEHISPGAILRLDLGIAPSCDVLLAAATAEPSTARDALRETAAAGPLAAALAEAVAQGARYEAPPAEAAGETLFTVRFPPA